MKGQAVAIEEAHNAQPPLTRSEALNNARNQGHSFIEPTVNLTIFFQDTELTGANFYLSSNPTLLSDSKLMMLWVHLQKEEQKYRDIITTITQ